MPSVSLTPKASWKFQANEFFFDEKEEKLYYFFNNTKPTGDEKWVATKTRVLFNITGTMAEPVTDVAIQGLTMRDTRITYLCVQQQPEVALSIC